MERRFSMNGTTIHAELKSHFYLLCKTLNINGLKTIVFILHTKSLADSNHIEMKEKNGFKEASLYKRDSGIEQKKQTGGFVRIVQSPPVCLLFTLKQYFRQRRLAVDFFDVVVLTVVWVVTVVGL